tara:strand:- start:258 stop:548 length:291 start_codon:yes stop_codon:yes gene_type:complete
LRYDLIEPCFLAAVFFLYDVLEVLDVLLVVDLLGVDLGVDLLGADLGADFLDDLGGDFLDDLGGDFAERYTLIIDELFFDVFLGFLLGERKFLGEI